jgi:hypothetical protein
MIYNKFPSDLKLIYRVQSSGFKVQGSRFRVNYVIGWRLEVGGKKNSELESLNPQMP